jgi:hypothetical protein
MIGFSGALLAATLTPVDPVPNVVSELVHLLEDEIAKENTDGLDLPEYRVLVYQVAFADNAVCGRYNASFNNDEVGFIAGSFGFTAIRDDGGALNLIAFNQSGPEVASTCSSYEGERWTLGGLNSDDGTVSETIAHMYELSFAHVEHRRNQDD